MPVTQAKRICQIIKLKPEYEEEYIQIHANVWPTVLSALARHNIADYSIHYHKPLRLLIAHFKYVGTDYEKDMAGIASDPETQRWWKVTDQMQESFQDGANGSGGSVPWWTDVPELMDLHDPPTQMRKPELTVWVMSFSRK